MGKGNVCVWGPYEGVYYVSNDYLSVYQRNSDPEETRLLKNLPDNPNPFCGWDYNEYLSADLEKEFVAQFKADFCHLFGSFAACDEWVGPARQYHAVMGNGLFYVCIADNQQSLAFILHQKDDDALLGLQKQHHRSYLDGMLRCLFEQVDSVGTYAGPWTSGNLKKADWLQRVA